MQVGQRVEIIDNRNVLFKSRGVVNDIHSPDYPLHGPLVAVSTEDGRKCLVEPKALRAA